MLHEKLQISSTTYILSQWPKNGKRCVRILVSTSNAKFRYYIKGLKPKLKKFFTCEQSFLYTNDGFSFFCKTVCNGFPKLHFFIRNLAQHYVCLSCSMLQYTLKKRKSTRPIQITDKAEEIILNLLLPIQYTTQNPTF